MMLQYGLNFLEFALKPSVLQDVHINSEKNWPANKRQRYRGCFPRKSTWNWKRIPHKITLFSFSISNAAAASKY